MVYLLTYLLTYKCLFTLEANIGNSNYAVLSVMSCCWISVAEDDVMKPVRNDTLGVHQITDCLKNGLEVVLLRFTTQNHVECLIDVLQHANHVYMHTFT